MAWFVVAYLVGYGPYVAVSIQELTGPPSAGAEVGEAAGSFVAGTALLLVLSALLAAFATERAGGGDALKEWIWGRRGQPAAAAFLTVGLVVLASRFGVVLGDLLQLPDAAAGSQMEPFGWVRAWQAVNAGVGEELVVLAAPVVVVRYCSPRWLASPARVGGVVLVLTVLRLLYHLHYGWSVLSLVPWAIVSVVVYLRWGRVWPLIVTHVSYDLLVFMVFGALVGSTAAVWVQTAVGLAAIAVGVGLSRRHRR